MNQLPVTLVTQNASIDSVSSAIYLDILKSLVEVDKMPFQAIATATGHMSKAWWNLRYHGVRTLDEDGKNALRRMSEEFPPQPPSVTAVTERMVHPDAAIWLVGDLADGEQVRRVVLVAGAENAAVSVNGTLQAYREPDERSDAVTPVTSSGEQDGGQRKPPKVYWRPSLPLSLKQRAQDAEIDIRQLIENALEMT